MAYLTNQEMDLLDRNEANLQILLGLRSCATGEDVCVLLDDIREHEKHMLKKEGLL